MWNAKVLIPIWRVNAKIRYATKIEPGSIERAIIDLVDVGNIHLSFAKAFELWYGMPNASDLIQVSLNELFSFGVLKTSEKRKDLSAINISSVSFGERGKIMKDNAWHILSQPKEEIADFVFEPVSKCLIKHAVIADVNAPYPVVSIAPGESLPEKEIYAIASRVKQGMAVESVDVLSSVLENMETALSIHADGKELKLSRREFDWSPMADANPRALLSAVLRTEVIEADGMDIPPIDRLSMPLSEAFTHETLAMAIEGEVMPLAKIVVSIGNDVKDAVILDEKTIAVPCLEPELLKRGFMYAREDGAFFRKMRSFEFMGKSYACDFAVFDESDSVKKAIQSVFNEAQQFFMRMDKHALSVYAIGIERYLQRVKVEDDLSQVADTLTQVKSMFPKDVMYRANGLFMNLALFKMQQNGQWDIPLIEKTCRAARTIIGHMAKNVIASWLDRLSLKLVAPDDSETLDILALAKTYCPNWTPHQHSPFGKVFKEKYGKKKKSKEQTIAENPKERKVIFDTCVLLDHLELCDALLENERMIVPLAVIGELDGLKKDNALSEKASLALKKLFVMKTSIDMVDTPLSMDMDSVDDAILCMAKEKDATLVTDDRGMFLKAMAMSIAVFDSVSFLDRGCA